MNKMGISSGGMTCLAGVIRSKLLMRALNCRESSSGVVVATSVLFSGTKLGSKVVCRDEGMVMLTPLMCLVRFLLMMGCTRLLLCNGKGKVEFNDKAVEIKQGRPLQNKLILA